MESLGVPNPVEDRELLCWNYDVGADLAPVFSPFYAGTIVIPHLLNRLHS